MFISIKSRLITGIVVLLLLLSVTAATGLYFVFRLDSSIKSLSEDVTPTIENTDDMIASLWEQGKVANEIMASESMTEMVELKGQIPELDKVFDESQSALVGLLSSEEQTVLQRAVKANESLSRNFDLMFQAHYDELQEEEKGKRLLVEFDDRGALIITALDEFANENEAEMAKAIEQGSQLAQRSGTTATDIANIIKDLFEHDYPVVEAALKLQRYVIEMQDTAGEYLAEEDAGKLPDIRRNFDALGNQVLELMVILDQLAESEEDKQDAVDLRQAFANWQKLALEDEMLFDTYRDQLEQETAADGYTEALEANIREADKALETLSAAADTISDNADDQAATSVASAMTVIGGVWLLALVMGGVIAIALIRVILGPVEQLQLSLQSIAKGDGDLTQRVNDCGGDEISLLGKSFNQFVSKIQALVSDISRESANLDASICSISGLSSRISTGVAQQSEEVDTVVQSINQVNEAADSISVNVTNCAEASQAASDDGQSAREVVQHAIRAVTGLANNIEETTVVIERLNTEVANIVSVLEVIQGIAEQTNLLALNAAIEAARAGEQGRGFAVVADEVRTLASRTQSCTNEIQTMIDSLKKGANDAVESMGRSKDGGVNTVAYARDAGEALNRILAAISNLNSMNEQIATAAEEQRAIVHSATHNANHVKEIVEDSMVAVHENQTFTDNMNQSVSRLNKLVGQFKV
ncbi:methyl-accepting chemotaxis protein [Shewanella sp. GXUN23E]|uniref:methyl-accepting chemotaxis protein n=1 Tax=Shewanella sp. GXUN23E TaxID=3422498 RepID=UPI003D7E83DC